MTIFLTGATGFIGANLALKLAELGHTVHALYRNPEKTGIIRRPGIVLFKGDILDRGSLKAAMDGCSQVYHLAAFTGKWAKEPELISRLNVDGARNVFELAREAGIIDIVFTSTAGVFGPSDRSAGGAVTGDAAHDAAGMGSYFLEYERTKALAEEMAKGYCREGMNIRIVNPTRVYGPGVLNDSNSVTKMIASFLKGTWRLIPGDGSSIGNYVFIDDVAEGHILAMEKGRPGENYLLSGENISYNGFFSLLEKLTGKRRFLVKVPKSLMLAIASLSMARSRLSGRPPFITKELVKKYIANWNSDCSKAVRELGYTVTPLEKGIARTIAWLEDHHHG